MGVRGWRRCAPGRYPPCPLNLATSTDREETMQVQTHALEQHPYRHLFSPTGARSRRSSSWDRSGGNSDWFTVAPGETKVLLEHDGPGCITHFYNALAFNAITDFRDS